MVAGWFACTLGGASLTGRSRRPTGGRLGRAVGIATRGQHRIYLERERDFAAHDAQADFFQIATKIRPQPVLIELVGHEHRQGVRFERNPCIRAEPQLVSLFADLIREHHAQGGYDLRIVLGHFLFSPCAQSQHVEIAPS